MKKIILISLFYTLFSCTSNRNMGVYGYAYSNDSVIITDTDNEILKIRVAGNEDERRLCPVNKPEVKIKSSEVKLKVQIDSSGIVVLDTVVVMPKEYKRPFITFVYPSSRTKFKRMLLAGDYSMFPLD
ncbi:hypothetical protein [Flavobacterium panacagri]|uniref:hypothetical protein n=1 Tax=Flavobacterium panacagri TaxID=3034146 RepID=UPI0025A64EB5|nr:hypothetical protein [Flavobacterium panacagri]